MPRMSPTPLKYTQLTPEVASEEPIQAALAALAALFNDRRRRHRAAVSSTCCATATSSRRGSSRRCAARGRYYDGKYYVKSVTHTIKRGEYKQSFTLARGGIGSSVSTVSV